jgi:methionyl-tRNA formyltransferase
MLPKAPSLGVLLLPSVRSLAYLDVLRSLDWIPQEVVLLQSEIPRLEAVRAEDRQFGYGGKYFDLSLDLSSYLQSVPKVIRVEGNDVNSPAVHEALKRCSSETFLFTGGGILTPETLRLARSSLHCHPGWVPDYRGSTCFYYSMLAESALGATAFLMDEQIDTGSVLARSRFRYNLRVSSAQPLFVDYILDPHIRACTLRKALLARLETGQWTGFPQEADDRPAFFVMHPWLRHLAIRRVNASYVETAPEGIFEEDGSK